MSYPDQNLTSLAKIRIKVRKLTRSLSENHLSTTALDDFINSFVLFDLPQCIDAEALKETFTFFTSPNVYEYDTNSDNEANPLYNFKNKYVFVSPSAFLSGTELRFYTSDRLFRLENLAPSAVKETENTGDGVVQIFSGTLPSYPVIPGLVSFTTKDADDKPMVLFDAPIVGNLEGQLYRLNTTDTGGTINYVTGAYELEFADIPKKSEPIYCETNAYIATKPSAILYSSNGFSLWPVPDKSYRIELIVKRRPTLLLKNDLDSPVPEISAWWEYIAYGASKKIFEDRADMNSLEAIMPELKRQESLIEKRKLETLSGQRAPTIYSI